MSNNRSSLPGKSRGRQRGRLNGGSSSRTGEPVETPPAPAIIVLKRRPASDAAVVTPKSVSVSKVDSKASDPIVLQNLSRSAKISEPVRSTTPTPLPELNSQTEKVKEKSMGVSLAETLSTIKKHIQRVAVPLIDNNMKLRPESCLDFLKTHEKNCDFIVVSAIGRPKSGKSTVLSCLTGEGNKIFPSRKRTEQKECFLYMNSQNVVYIEIAAIFNAAAAADLVKSAGHGNMDGIVMSWSLTLMRLALSISHVVLLVSSEEVDADLLQLVESAGLVSPIESFFGQYPKIVSISPGRRCKNQFSFSDKRDELRDAINMIKNLCLYFRTQQDQSMRKMTMYDWFQKLSRCWEEISHPRYFADYVKLEIY